MFNFTNIYFDYHIIVKFYRVYDLDCGFNGLRCKIQVNLICYHLNIKKKYHFKFFLKSNHVFYYLFKLSLNLSNQLDHVNVIFTRLTLN
jgi:hypothetical protein